MSKSNTPDPSKDENRKITDSDVHDDQDDDDFGDSLEMSCDVCNIPFTGVESYELHVNGKKHRKKVQAVQMMKKLDLGGDETQTSSSNERESGEQIYCNVCNLSCSGYIPYRQHLKSSKHLKQLKKAKIDGCLKNTPEVLPGGSLSTKNIGTPNPEEPYGRCDICNKIFYAPETLKQHMGSPAHAKKVAQNKMKQEFLNADENHDAMLILADENETSVGVIKSYAECKTCSKKFSGPESFKMHLLSQNHQRKVQIQKEDSEAKSADSHVLVDGQYICKECNKSFGNFISLKQHLTCNNHNKQMAKKEIAEFLEKYPEIVILPPTEEGTDDTNAPSDAISDFYSCNLCGSSFSGPECAKQHVMGKTHKRIVTIMKRIKESKASKDNPKKIEFSGANDGCHSESNHVSEKSSGVNATGSVENLLKADEHNDCDSLDSKDGFEIIDE